MSAMRRTAGTVSAVVVLSGLVGGAAGCAGGSASDGGGATASSGSGSGGVAQKAAAPEPLGVLRGSAVGGGAARDISHATAALRSVPAIRSAVIKTASLDLRVPHGRFGTVMDAASRIATRFGGFVSRRSSSGTRVHDGDLVMRVPVRRFQPALVAVEHLGRPTGESVAGQDVTQQFVNLDARLGNLQSQERALRQLMGRAQTVPDTIRVQSVLQNVELQMEEIQGQLIYLQNRTSMATIAIAVHEAGRRPVPPAHASALWKAGTRSLDAATAVVSGVIVGAGLVIPIAILALLAVLIGRLAAPWAAPLAARRRGPARTPPE
jgi:hypothetical protein